MRQKSAGGSFAFIGSTFTGSKRKPAYVKQAAASPGGGPASLFQPMLFGKRKRSMSFLYSCGSYPYYFKYTCMHTYICIVCTKGMEMN